MNESNLTKSFCAQKLSDEFTVVTNVLRNLIAIVEENEFQNEQWFLNVEDTINSLVTKDHNKQ